MKKLLSLLVVLAMIFSSIVITPAPVKAEEYNYSLTLGKEYKGTLKGSLFYTLEMNDTANFTFTIAKKTNILVDVKYSGKCSGSLKTKSGSYVSVDSRGVATVTAGTYVLSLSGYQAQYIAKISDIGLGTVKFKKTSGNIKEYTDIPFTYTCSYAQAKTDIKLSNSKSKVASAKILLNSDGTGVVRAEGKFIGKTNLTLQLVGGNSSRFSAYVRTGMWFVAKGSKAKMPKPVGFKKLKWKSSKKKVATINKKSGKIKAKKGGRTTITAKKGKEKFTIKLVVTDYIKLAKTTYREIKDAVNNPDKLKIYNVYKGYSKQIYTNGIKVPVIMIDFGSTNDFGAMMRKKVMAYYDDVHEPKYIGVSNANNIISKKSIKKSKIK